MRRRQGVRHVRGRYDLRHDQRSMCLQWSDLSGRVLRRYTQLQAVRKSKPDVLRDGRRCLRPLQRNTGMLERRLHQHDVVCLPDTTGRRRGSGLSMCRLRHEYEYSRGMDGQRRCRRDHRGLHGSTQLLTEWPPELGRYRFARRVHHLGQQRH